MAETDIIAQLTQSVENVFKTDHEMASAYVDEELNSIIQNQKTSSSKDIVATVYLPELVENLAKIYFQLEEKEPTKEEFIEKKKELYKSLNKDYNT